jgi:endonuclease YncB( thermonuclease family)
MLRRLVLLVVPLTVAAPAGAGDLAARASVFDGDTIEIHGQRIGFFGIDAPESQQICQADGRADLPRRLRMPQSPPANA